MDHHSQNRSDAAGPSAGWRPPAPGQPAISSAFERALRRTLAQAGSATIRDGWLESSDGRLPVVVTVSQPDSSAGDDFFEVSFSDKPHASNPTAEPPLMEAQLQKFLHKLSHDLRTPLSALQMWIKITLEGEEPIPPGVLEGLEAIRKCAEEQQALVAGVVSRPIPR